VKNDVKRAYSMSPELKSFLYRDHGDLRRNIVFLFSFSAVT